MEFCLVCCEVKCFVFLYLRDKISLAICLSRKITRYSQTMRNDFKVVKF